MKLLKRNLTDFEYLPYAGEETDIDPETGLHTGEFRFGNTYGDPVEYEGNISTPSQYVNPALFGTDIRYTHILLMDDPEVEMDEYGLVRYEGDLYEIRAVRRSLNSVSIALRKKSKDHAAETDGEPETEPDPAEPSDPDNPDEPDEPGDGGGDGTDPTGETGGDGTNSTDGADGTNSTDGGDVTDSTDGGDGTDSTDGANGTDPTGGGEPDPGTGTDGDAP